MEASKMRLFKRKEVIIERRIEFSVTPIDAKAFHIKRTGSYILQLDYTVNEQVAKEILDKLKQSTGAKWGIIQGGARVIEVN
jgi:hypothetical protein